MRLERKNFGKNKLDNLMYGGSNYGTKLSLNPHKNLESIIATSTITLTCFILSFVFGSLSFIPRDIHAEVAQVSTNITPVISLVLDETDLVIAPVDVTSGAVATNTLTATVSTNNVTGYSLSMSTTSEDIDLTHTNGVSKITSTASASPATLSSNTWGYNLTDSLTDFRKIPALSAVSIIKSSSSPVLDEETKVTIGVKANISIPAGTYSNELVLTAVANYVPPTLPATMQAFTTQHCSAMSAFQNGGTQIMASTGDYLTNQNTAILTDTRNSQTYRIRKLADNKCWMIDNLKIYNATLTDADTNITVSGNTFTLPAALTTAASTVNNAARIDDPSGQSYCTPSTGAVYTAFPGTTTGCGYLYNWYAATLGSNAAGTTLNTGATNAGLINVSLADSICPKNWHLPTGGSGGEYEVLDASLALGGDGLKGSNQLIIGFEGVYSGTLNGSGLNFQGSGGYFMSSSAYTNATNSYHMFFNSTSSYPAFNFGKSTGNGVRCSL